LGVLMVIILGCYQQLGIAIRSGLYGGFLTPVQGSGARLEPDRMGKTGARFKAAEPATGG